MTYPNLESREKRKKAKAEERTAVAKLYAESESFQEFDLKRRALEHRVPRLFWRDPFRAYYFYSNGREWLYECGWLAPVMTFAGFFSFVFAVAACRCSSATYAAIFGAATFFLVALARIYAVSKDAARKARKMLRDLPWTGNSAPHGI